MKRIYLFGLLSIAGFLMLQSCGVTYVSVPVTKPAEVNLTKFKKVTLGEFTGRNGNHEIYNTVQNYLVNSGKLEVLDRHNLDRILMENGLAYAGLTEGDNPSRLSKLIGAAALISGHVSNYDYKEEVKKGEPYKDKEGKSHVMFTRNGKAEINTTFTITDLTTGKIFFSKNLERRKELSTTAEDKQPDQIDRNRLLEMARNDLIDGFMKLIVPHTELVSVQFLDESDFPDMDKGISFAKAGNWDKSIEIFKDLTAVKANNEKLSKVYYNLGIAYQYNYRFDKAREAFERALSLYNDDRYVNAMNGCRVMEEEQIRVQKQMEEANHD